MERGGGSDVGISTLCRRDLRPSAVLGPFLHARCYALSIFGLSRLPSQVELAAAAAPKMVKPISSEPHMVHAAESATANFANNDVSRAVLKAQQQAKAQYQAMMASALKVWPCRGSFMDLLNVSAVPSMYAFLCIIGILAMR